MNWPSYPTYKESTATWVGQVPTHWAVGKVKHGFTVTLGKMYQGEATTATDVLLPHLKAGSLSGSGVILADPMLCWFSPGELSTLSLRKNDLLVAEGGSIGKCAILPEDLPQWGFQKSLNRVRVRDNDDIRFLAYLIQCATECGHVGVLCGRSTIQHFTAEKLANLDWPHPAPAEQEVIADFLDSETAKIDALIGKQEQLIATLREDRTATIDFSFPAAAGLTRLKAVLLFAQTGPFGTQLSAEEYIADGIPVINPTHIQDNKIVPDIGISVSAGKADDLARHRFRIGDIVLGRKGEVDKSALVGTKSAGFICGSDAMLLRPRLDVIVPAYLWWFLQSPSAHSQLEQWSVGSTVAGLNQTTMRKIYLPHPSIEVQRQIVDRLQAQTAKLDALIAKATHVIETLHEYRSALITDAVTGKIDLRGAV